MTFHYAGDQALLLTLGDEICLETNDCIRRLLRVLEAHPIPEIRNLHPAYTTVLITFDPCRSDHVELERELRARMAQADSVVLPPPAIVDVPACYGGDFGPDLEDVARLHGLTPGAVIRLHSEALYTVYFLGFVPGFAYLGGLPDTLATPRLTAPRKTVPAGTVGIAGSQTGVYPFATPGGWRLIAKTPLQIFRANREPASLFAIGDQVRFRPVSLAEYQSIAKARQ